jgi:alkylation response protein AidB-like acyl-CoA dehydrogenase
LVGGYGLYTNVEFAGLLNEVKVLRIAGGSVEILRNYIARKALKEAKRGSP